MSTDVVQIAPDFSVDVDYMAGRSVALLGKKGSGKTFAMRVLAEEFHKAGVQSIILDPMGVFWGLRMTSDGQHAGLDMTIFGGSKGDYPLDHSDGADLADMAIRSNSSMILDMSEFTSRDQERQFVRDFLDRLYRANKDRSLMHVFIDEADLYAPQKPSAKDGPLLETMQNLVRRGRNFGIGTTMATQRPAVLSKDVLTQVDVLVALRMIASHDRDAIRAWVDGQDNSEDWERVGGSLATLENGEAWWWVPEQNILSRVQIRRTWTFDSSPTRTRGMELQTLPSLLPTRAASKPMPEEVVISRDYIRQMESDFETLASSLVVMQQKLDALRAQFTDLLVSREEPQNRGLDEQVSPGVRLGASLIYEASDAEEWADDGV